ncbi:MAG TPA: elongation factor P [Verrucomicrobiales bacterium]|nr:elongation factor P [Verrucomicrobiales bacterium]|tara:strand:- start:1069 stop:1629 length:561 start_codon:yes stop_codon:yes gene_type:complete
MAIANDIRRGNAIKFNGAVCVVMETGHVKPGKGPAYIQAKIRNLATGKSSDQRFNSSESVEIVPMTTRKLEFSYMDGEDFVLSDPETYEQETASPELMAEVKDFMTENTPLTATYVGGTLAMIELPANVILEVADAPEGVKGDSASNVMKSITLETGVVIQAPLFIKTGEKIKVDVKNRKYLERAS